MNDFIYNVIIFGLIRYSMPNYILSKNIKLDKLIVTSLCYALAVYVTKLKNKTINKYKKEKTNKGKKKLQEKNRL